MKKLYAERHGLLLGGLSQVFSQHFSLNASTAGLSIFGSFLQSKAAFHELGERLTLNRVGWQDTSHYYDRVLENSALFGFSHLSNDQIVWALARLGDLANLM
jgi:GntR family transcriptional regulator / MocR family aminotransferase